MSQPMRFLLVSNTYPPADVSGVGTLVCELAARLGQQGHRVTVITRQAPRDDLHAVSVGGPKLLFPLLAAWRYWRLASLPWDAVHVHESDGVVVAVLVRLRRALGLRGASARLLATLQVSYVQERRAVRPVRADGHVVSRPTASEWLFAWLRAPLLALLGRLTARLADAVVAPSAATAAELRADYGIAAVTVIPNGVAVPPLPTPATVATGSPGPTIAFAGRLRTRKAAAVLLAALPRVRERVSRAHLLVLGGGEQEHALHAMVRRLGLAHALELPGVLPRNEVTRRLAHADVFCLPSTYEGMPLAILEAMSLGLPVVATAVSGNPEAVEHGVCGLLVPAESATALADALSELLTDPDLRQRMGEAARRRVEEHFAIGLVVDRYVELLQGLRAAPAEARAPAALPGN
jgi:glycosyltransferase involved in cell wall biosynthesis